MRHRNENQRPASSSSDCGGFTLIEILVTVAIIGISMAIVVPNLGALVPSARIDGAGRAIRSKITELRSEARIQAKQMGIEFDLDKARWRVIYPPEEQLTSDQEIIDYDAVADHTKAWIDLETDVRFAAAGSPRTSYFEKGLYRLMFDEYGFTGDQVIALQLISDETMIWSLSVQGLTGAVETHRSEIGEMLRPTFVEEGAF